MLISRAMMLFVSICTSVVPISAQSQTQKSNWRNGSIGASVGLLGPRDKFVEGTNSELSGWADIGGGKWTLNVDAAVTRRLKGMVEPVLDRTVPRGPGTRFDQRWVIGVSGLRRIPISDRREVLHLLLGGGIISKKRSYVFDDPAFPQERSSNVESSAEVVMGAGMDIPLGRLLARLQGRLNYGNPMSAYQFRVGVGMAY